MVGSKEYGDVTGSVLCKVSLELFVYRYLYGIGPDC